MGWGLLLRTEGKLSGWGESNWGDGMEQHARVSKVRFGANLYSYFRMDHEKSRQFDHKQSP
jgi:hypothetical protein